MAAPDDEKLRNLVNTSGFPLQLAVEHRVKSLDRSLGWEVIASEHPWRDAASGSDKFLDILLGWGMIRLVTECKRPKGGEWVFLNRRDTFRRRTHIRTPWMLYVPGTDGAKGVGEITPEPDSYQAEFCVVRGGNEERPMIERIAGELLAACDALADEELAILQRRQAANTIPRVLIPTIVTSAKLYAASVDPNTVSLEDGEIDATQFEEVSLVRFRKTLTTELTSDAEPENLQEAHRNKQRTVLVIAAEHVDSVLSQWQLEAPAFAADYPWAAARALLEKQAQKRRTK